MLNLIIEDNNTNKHVAHDVAREFESAILSDSRTLPAKSSLLSRSLHKLYPYLYRFHLPIPNLPFNVLQGDYVAVMMGTWNFEHCMPYFMAKGQKYAYIFDAWTVVHKNIIKFVKRWDVDHVFVSSSQVANILNGYDTKCEFHWIPEGLDFSVYKSLDFADKDIDVLQIGRKYDAFHDQIVDGLEQKNISYLYEKVKGELIFPQREDFINGLARSKISICFPSNITHPERAGEIETLTNRYLQSMASKCLIVGQAPLELIELFGYNPVIESDPKNPLGQLEFIVKYYENYIPLIERNYNSLKEHTWPKRWEKISKIIFSNGKA